MHFKKTIPLIFLFAFLLHGWETSGQNIILPGGEYMDTSTNVTNCKDYNAYFYQVHGKYPESSSSILEEVNAFRHNKNQTYTGNGYITFRFTVDCEGKVMNKIQVLQTDENYKPKHFQKQFVDELFLFFKTMKKWKIAKTKEGTTFNYFAFLTFKIHDGKVINIIP